MQINTSPEDRDRFRKEYLALASRYGAASDIRNAHAVLLEIEEMFRSRGHVGFYDRGDFCLEMGTLLARRSEISSRLGDSETASLLMDEALQHLRESPLAMDFALLTPRAVLKLIHELDAKSGVKWRQT